jgi:hypothetical protein
LARFWYTDSRRGKPKHLGFFEDPTEAYQAWRKEALSVYGEEWLSNIEKKKEA